MVIFYHTPQSREVKDRAQHCVLLLMADTLHTKYPAGPIQTVFLLNLGPSEEVIPRF